MNVFVTGATGYIGRRLIPVLMARGHRVKALVRPGSEGKAPADCEIVAGDPFNHASFAGAIGAGDTIVQLVGVPHPSPAKARQFVDIDLRSAMATIAAATQAGAGHVVYVSVAQPSPVMQAYQAVRRQVEEALAAAGLTRTILRPWYVLGPGHRWPCALLPIYWVMERIPATRARARRLGLVTLDQMLAALVHAVEHPPSRERVMDVPAIRDAKR